MIFNIKMIILKIFFIPIWLFVVFFCILMYLYDIAAGNKPRQSFRSNFRAFRVLEIIK